MIKIIKEGHKPREIIPHYCIECDNCHTLFECDKTDTWYHLVGHGEGGQYVRCPKCGSGISEFMNPNWSTTNIEEIRHEREMRQL